MTYVPPHKKPGNKNAHIQLLKNNLQFSPFGYKIDRVNEFSKDIPLSSLTLCLDAHVTSRDDIPWLQYMYIVRLLRSDPDIITKFIECNSLLEESDINDDEISNFAKFFKFKFYTSENIFTQDNPTIGIKRIIILHLYYALFKSYLLCDGMNPEGVLNMKKYCIKYEPGMNIVEVIGSRKEQICMIYYKDKGSDKHIKCHLNGVFFICWVSDFRDQKDTFLNLNSILHNYFLIEPNRNNASMSYNHNMHKPIFQNKLNNSKICDEIFIGDIGDSNKDDDKIICMLINRLLFYISNLTTMNKEIYLTQIFEYEHLLLLRCIDILNSKNGNLFNGNLFNGKPTQPSNIMNMSPDTFQQSFQQYINKVNIPGIRNNITTFWKLYSNSPSNLKRRIANYLANIMHNPDNYLGDKYNMLHTNIIEGDQHLTTTSTIGKIDQNTVSGKQIILGSIDTNYQIPMAERNNLRGIVGPRHTSEFNSNMEYITSQLLTFTIAFNKLMTLCISRTNLIFPARVYLDNLESFTPYKKESFISNDIDAINLFGLLMVHTTTEPLYFYKMPKPSQLRVTDLLSNIQICSYQFLTIQPGFVYSNNRLTYDELNILIVYLGMQLYKCNSSEKLFVFSHLINEDSDTRNIHKLKTIFNITDHETQKGIIKRFKEEISQNNGENCTSLFRSMKYKDLNTIFSSLVSRGSHETHGGSNSTIVKSLNPMYNYCKSNKYNTFIHYFIKFDNTYSDMLFNYIKFHYILYPYGIYGECLKSSIIKFNHLLLKRVKSITNWTDLFLYSYIKGLYGNKKIYKICNISLNTSVVNKLIHIDNNTIVDSYYFIKYNLLTKRGYSTKTLITSDIYTNISNGINKIQYILSNCNYKEFKLTTKYDIILCQLALTNINYTGTTTLYEFSNINLYLDELIVGLLALNTGGSIILRVDGLQSKLLLKIIYTVSKLFKEYILEYPHTGALYSGRINVVFKGFTETKQFKSIINKLKRLSDAYDDDNVYDCFNINYGKKIRNRDDVNYINKSHDDTITKQYVNDSLELYELPKKELERFKDFNENIAFRRLIYFYNIIYLYKNVFPAKSFNKTQFIKYQYNKQLICSYLYSVDTDSKFLKDEFSKLKFNITYKDIYKNIYLISTVKETLSDTKKIIDLYVKRFSNTKSTTIKQSDNSVLDTESLDKIADYIKYFNDFYKVQDFEKLIGSTKKTRHLLHVFNKTKTSTSFKMNDNTILYTHSLLDIKKVLVGIEKNNVSVLFKLDLSTLKQNKTKVYDALVQCIHVFSKTYLWKSSFDFDMSVIYIVAQQRINEPVVRSVIVKCRPVIVEVVNIISSRISFYYLKRDLLPIMLLHSKTIKTYKKDFMKLDNIFK